LGSDIVLPGAALIAMAIEAMAQVSQALSTLEQKPQPDRPCYRLRNATFLKALVLEEGKRHDVMLNLATRAGSKDSWHEFRVLSSVNGGWIEHCKGLVRIERDPQIGQSKL
jgi:hypothetical protein